MKKYAVLLITAIALGACNDEKTKDELFVLPDTPDMILDAMVLDNGLMVDAQDADDSGMNDLETDAVVLSACEDGVDNDGDGQTDYPIDDGCSTSTDDDETDPDFPACDDGTDNDNDGLVDFEDPGCSSFTDPDENNSCGPGLSFRDISNTPMLESVTMGASRLNSCRNNQAPELLFLFTLRSPVAALSFETTGSSFDTILGVYRGCPGDESPELCGDDQSATDRTSKVSIEAPELGDYYLVVDGHNTESGEVILAVNQYVEDGELCDDLPEGTSCRIGRQCSAGICVPNACSNGIDDNFDGRTDFPEDPGCESPEDESEETPTLLPECGDGGDNDFDGLIDYPFDPDCTSASDPEERGPNQCSDNRDNDNDGLVDLDDPGCLGNPDRNDEYNSPACENGFDDDEDGLIDFPEEPGCLYPQDNDEVDPEPLPECSDGLDNDRDGDIDYPDDVDSCFFAADPFEDDPCRRITPIDISGQSRLRGNLSVESGSFAGQCGGQAGHEMVFLYRVPPGKPLSNLIIRGRAGFYDAILYVRDACDAATEVECTTSGRLELGPQPEGEKIWIFLDHNQSESITYRLDIEAILQPEAECGGDGFLCPDGLTCQLGRDGYRCLSAACDDGIDNDDDGRIDYPHDPGCASPEDEDEDDPLAAPMCSNGYDDDGDGLIDFGQDPECSSAADPDERPECSDGIDNDGDGRVDFDRNRDGTPDTQRDFQCACALDISEASNPACSDGCDNDNDGLIDMLDPGCEDPNDSDESHVAQCNDGIDNNGDGLIDFPEDPACPNLLKVREQTLTEVTACNDGVDNDGDGAIDHSSTGGGDSGCLSAADTDERPSCEEDSLILPNSGIFSGDTRNHGDKSTSLCATTTTGQAPDIRFRLDIPRPAKVIARLNESTFNANLYARTTCEEAKACPSDEPDCGLDAPELACSTMRPNSSRAITVTEHQGELFLFVDGQDGHAGTFTLNVEVLFPSGEQCLVDDREYMKCENDGICSYNVRRGYLTCN